MTWLDRATGATRKAAQLRASLGFGPADAVCPIDIAIQLELDVWFRAEPSLEGLYVPGTPSKVIINSLRPAGRRRYTAGHEVGHHVHGHGASLDAQIHDEATVDEFVANRFARALLMPKLVVANAYARRGWSPGTTSAVQAFVVAQDLGVGFTTLLEHMAKTLHLIDGATAKELGRRPLPKVRAELVGREVERDAVLVDEHWGARPLDIEVGDVVVAPADARLEGACLASDGVSMRATRAGIGVLSVPGRSEGISVRVTKREFVGRAIYRHLEDPDDD